MQVCGGNNITNYVNEIHELGPFGKLHVCSFNGDNVMGLRAICKTTEPDDFHGDVSKILPQHVLSIMNQVNNTPNHKLFLQKVPDGYILVSDKGQVVCAIKDPHLCDRVDDSNRHSHLGGEVTAYSIVCPPEKKIMPFVMAKDVHAIIPHDHISNFTSIDHIVAKMKSAVPFSEVPRTVFCFPDHVILDGHHIKGNNAYFMKKTFLKLIKNNGGKNIYDIPIKMTENISGLLNLNDPEGNVCIAPLVDGIMGYRNRKNNAGKTLIFMCNSDDFFNSEPKPPCDSTLQVYKLNYMNKKCKAARILVQTKPTDPDYSQQEGNIISNYNVPPITPQMTVQDSLSIMDHIFRMGNLDHINCGDFPDYCATRKYERSMMMGG